MKDPMVLVPPGSLQAGATVALENDEEHHLHVRRKTGARSVIALDGRGVVAQGELAPEGRDLMLHVTSIVTHPMPPATVLAVGAGDRERFLWLAEKCTELGVTIWCRSTPSARPPLRRACVQRALRRLAAARAKPANRAAILGRQQIDDIATFYELPRRYPATQWLLADPAGGAMPATGPTDSVGWCIGPEGGFVSVDFEIIQELLSPASVQLGPFILRFETAAVVAATLTRDRRAAASQEG